MAGQSSRGRYYHYPSHASMSPMDPGQMYGATREMGPPPLADWPPQPVEIPVDANISRTLPSPQATVSTSNTWDAALLQPNFGDLYGPSNHPRLQQLSLDGQNRSSPTAQLPLAQWYLNNDGPWIPKGISETVPEDRSQSRQTDNQMHSPYIAQYKAHNPSDPGSFQYPVPSDSGYGTRRSDGNASVFSADVPERDQDCQNLQGQVPEYQPYPVHNDLFPSVGRVADPSWSHPTSSLSSTSRLVCPTCHKPIKTQSEMKKHDLRHTKPFICTVPGCLRTDGFSTTNDLERHTKSKHPSAMPETAMTKKFRCLVPGCKSKEKSWPRLDNFRSHLKRVHGNQEDEDLEDLIRRGEYTEKNGLAVQEKESTQQPTGNLEQPRTMREDVHDTQSGQKAQPKWRSNYPDVNGLSREYVAPNAPQEEFEPKVVTSNESSPPQTPQPETVQPLEVLPTQSRIPGKISSDKVLAPVGQNKPVISKAEPASSPSFQRGGATGKAPRQNLVSASDAIIGVVKKALAAANITDAPHRVNHQDSERNCLPSGRMSSRESWPVDPSSAASSSRGENGSIKPMDTPTPEEEAQDSDILNKEALEILRIIRQQGYILQKDTTHAPKAHNLGSAASNRSENKVTCQTCQSFTGRPCELKKHMKRHERPYGCTFLTCNKTFGSKNDWKRHENSQHFHLETWRCDKERLQGGICAKVYYRRQTFQEHLTKAHEMSDKELINSKLDSCRIGRNCQSRFWCGFCNKLVELKKRGVDAWTERFDHIDDHFMGRHKLQKQGIQDWVPMDSDRPKGEVESPHALGSLDEDGPSQSASGSPTGTSAEAKASAGGSPGQAASHEEVSSTNAGPKRSRSSSDHDASQPPHKRARPDTVVYCCQCKTPHNPRIDLRCTGCPDSPHPFCSSCKVEFIIED